MKEALLNGLNLTQNEPKMMQAFAFILKAVSSAFERKRSQKYM
jgi:hypothetical protein